MTLPKGTIKCIHVDRRVMASNRRTGANEPALTIQTSKGPIKASFVRCAGLMFFMQANHADIKPLACGARAWVETRAEVEYV